MIPLKEEVLIEVAMRIQEGVNSWNEPPLITKTREFLDSDKLPLLAYILTNKFWEIKPDTDDRLEIFSALGDFLDKYLNVDIEDDIDDIKLSIRTGSLVTVNDKEIFMRNNFFTKNILSLITEENMEEKLIELLIDGRTIIPQLKVLRGTALNGEEMPRFDMFAECLFLEYKGKVIAERFLKFNGQISEQWPPYSLIGTILQEGEINEVDDDFLIYVVNG